MQPVKKVTGRMAPLDLADVDTDQIIPKQFLKRIERTGYGPFLFFDWRARGGFVLDRPEHAGASVLVAGANFGCGSSREHAPWALRDFGFKAIIAPSFADIFRQNCYKTGLLAVTLPESQVRHLMDLAEEDPQARVTVDLVAQKVGGEGFDYGFEIDAFARECLLEGLDDVGLVERHGAAIAAFENHRPGWMPTASGFTRGAKEAQMAEKTPMTVETLQAFLAAFNRHDLDAIMTFFTEDAVMEFPRGASPWGTRAEGLADIRSLLATRFSGIPDVHYGDDRHMVCGDRGVSEWTISGTSAGTRIEVRGCDLFEFEGGRISRKDSYWKIVDRGPSAGSS